MHVEPALRAPATHLQNWLLWLLLLWFFIVTITCRRHRRKPGDNQHNQRQSRKPSLQQKLLLFIFQDKGSIFVFNYVSACALVEIFFAMRLIAVYDFLLHRSGIVQNLEYVSLHDQNRIGVLKVIYPPFFFETKIITWWHSLDTISGRSELSTSGIRSIDVRRGALI